MAVPPANATPVQTFEFELPSGGVLHLQSMEEVDLMQTSHDRLEAEYAFEKLNDKMLFSSLLTQQLVAVRSQQKISGMVPEFDTNGKPLGTYKFVKLKPAEEQGAHKALINATEQIQAIEKQLGIDKKTRDAGNTESVQSYLVRVKRAALSMGVHITERGKEYEAFCMELRKLVRMLDNLDAEDRQHHAITKDNVLNFVRKELERLEQVDKDFAKQKGHLWRGKL